MPHTELRAAPTGPGLPYTPNPISASGTQTLPPGTSQLTAAVPTYFLCPFRDPALGRGPLPCQAQNKHTHPGPSPTHGCPWERDLQTQEGSGGRGFQDSFHLSI